MKRSREHVQAQKAGRQRDLNRCQICGSPDKVEGHHIIDVAFGGASNPDNIIALCHDCHKKVHQGKIDVFKF